MNRELFSDAMNEIDSKYVEEALTYKPAKRFVFPVWVQRCVAACLICVLGLGVVLAASPEARAEIQRWIETWRGSQVSYTYFGDPLEKPIPHYQITALPEGFAEELDQRFDETDCVQHSYRRGDERIILGYIYMQDDNFSFMIWVRIRRSQNLRSTEIPANFICRMTRRYGASSSGSIRNTASISALTPAVHRKSCWPWRKV